MEFKEVKHYINRDTSGNTSTPLDTRPPLDHVDSNPYHTLLGSPVYKPTLANFVHRLRQKSSRTRFIETYNKLANASNMSDKDGFLADSASVRIIDASREPTRDRNHQPQQPVSDDCEVVNLVVSSKKKGKRVHINESANQIQPAFHDDEAADDRFISVQQAIVYMNKDIDQLQDAIEKEIKKIAVKQEEIIKYRDECHWMQTQMDAIHDSVSGLLKDNIPEMRSIRDRLDENEAKVKTNTKKNGAQTYKFERYRKAANVDMRLMELEKKIKAAWARDVLWASFRDWACWAIVSTAFIVTFLLVACGGSSHSNSII